MTLLELSRPLLMALAASLMLSCYRLQIVATDGSIRSLAGGELLNGPEAREAVAASAVHDIPCPNVSVVTMGDRDSWSPESLVEGCGQRVTYRFVDNGNHVWRFLLASRVRIGAP